MLFLRQFEKCDRFRPARIPQKKKSRNSEYSLVKMKAFLHAEARQSALVLVCHDVNRPLEDNVICCEGKYQHWDTLTRNAKLKLNGAVQGTPYNYYINE